MFNGQNIKKRRAELALSQGDVSKLTGIAPSTISLYEKNLKDPQAKTIAKLATALKVNASYFFG